MSMKNNHLQFILKPHKTCASFGISRF